MVGIISNRRNLVVLRGCILYDTRYHLVIYPVNAKVTEFRYIYIYIMPLDLTALQGKNMSTHGFETYIHPMSGKRFTTIQDTLRVDR